ncbi:MAG: FAD-dependent oxidoreductase [Pirellulales bacterium]
MTSNQTAIVIGGGVIGCTTAYYLSKQGWQVRVVEARRVGRGASHGNCGYICPSHVLPLTSSDALWSTMKKMFSKDSAIYIKPRWDPSLWWWLIRFAMRCRHSAMMEAARARHTLLQSAMTLYREMLAEEHLDVEWEDRGLLLVWNSPHEFETYQKAADFTRNEFGIGPNRVEGSQLTAIEPALRSGLAGGWHWLTDAHLRPDRLMTALRELLERRGVEIQEGVQVNDFEVTAGRAAAIETSSGRMAAELFVVAAGAESPAFARRLGCRLPIQPGKGYSITMPRPQGAPTTPLIFEEYHVAVTPWPSGMRIGSTMEFAGYDRTINRRRIDLFKRAAAEYLVGQGSPPADPNSNSAPAVEEWYGWRPMTYDDVPIIGRAPRAENVVVAAGHGMIGVASGSASGKLAAELATGSQPHIDPAPYSLRRFG